MRSPRATFQMSWSCQSAPEVVVTHWPSGLNTEKRPGPVGLGSVHTGRPDGTSTICRAGFSPQMEAVRPSGLKRTPLTVLVAASSGATGSPVGTERILTPSDTRAMSHRPSGE